MGRAEGGTEREEGGREGGRAAEGCLKVGLECGNNGVPCAQNQALQSVVSIHGPSGNEPNALTTAPLIIQAQNGFMFFTTGFRFKKNH